MVVRRALALLIIACTILFISDSAFHPDTVLAQETPEAINDVPDTLLNETLMSYSIAGTKLFWDHLTMVNCDPDVNSKTFDEFIRRVAVQGSIMRTLFETRTVDSICGPSITSNIVADSDNVYFVRGALHRMSVLANPGDSIPTIAADVAGNAELLMRGAHLYVLTESKGLWRVDRADSTAVRLLTAGQVGNAPHNFQSDGKYAYWLISGGQLRQMKYEDNSTLNFGATNISNYATFSTICIGSGCIPTRYIYMGMGNQLRRFDADTRLFDKEIWTGNASEDRFDEMVVTRNNLFFVAEEQTTCEPFCSHNTLLFRMQRDGNGSPELIYTGQSGINSAHSIIQLTANGSYLYWIDSGGFGTLKRLPQNASALPLTNLRITNIEITQAIQTLNNDVPIIEDKRTFVRVHAQADGDAVDGVTAKLFLLDAPNGNTVGDPLTPSNPIGQYLTLSSAPSRAVIDHSFLFELPMAWVERNDGLLSFLNLRAEINPYKSPPQASYANNVQNKSVVLMPSPRFDLRFVLFRYVVNGTVFKADTNADFNQTVSWIRRAYPISSIPTSIGHSGPGFGPGYTIITDNELKNYITQSECDFDDDMCASDYVHGLLEDWDDDWQFDYAMMYGMMPAYTSPYSGKSYFPRGSTSGDTSNGPSGVPGGAWDWDVDGTYADWYAGHEIGHLLDRDHPTPGGDPDTDDETQVGCGHSQDDDDYPYSGARIDSSAYFGFDPGNPKKSAIMTPTVYAGNGAFDVMSYCQPIQWMSNYTYMGLYQEMFDLAASAQVAGVDNATANGDYLYLYGVINPTQEAGHFVRLRRKSGEYTPNIPGSSEYVVRLLGADSGELASINLVATEDHESLGRLIFQTDIAFVAGTRTIQVVHQPSGKIYISHSLSANPPLVENVTLQSATNPVTGTVALSWTASDPDNDLLSYDIHYSIDNGLTFQPIQANLTSTSTQINTLELGGSGQALLRVTAFDGGNTTTATTAPFMLANKPPVVAIDNPANGIHVQYGQLINFIGDAWDPQWQSFVEAELRWSSEDGPLGTGATLSRTDLEVGTHIITFTAKNSAGLEASTSVTVTVDDDLAIHGATLAVAPAQLGWHFAEGETTAQSATLTIANVGSGTFSWTASTAAPWLTLSANQGSAPAEIMVTADPTQIPDGASISSSVLVTASIGSGQFSLNIGTATIPAHAVFGNGYTAAFPGPEQIPGQENVHVFLPTILTEE